MKNFFLIIICQSLLVINLINAQETHFQLIVLGNGGGLTEANQSSYLLSNGKKNEFICLDAGVVLEGISKSIKNKNFGNIKFLKNQLLHPEYYILQNYIKAYLISHPHFDHIAGLLAAATYDNNKAIYATHHTIESMIHYVFNGKIFADLFSESGSSKYKLIAVNQGDKVSIDDSFFKIESFYLSHNKEISTAFLIENAGYYFLYFGDTGSDISEKSNNLENIWNYITPIIRERKLKAILIECSFSNEIYEDQLFGHLNPKLLSSELQKLEELVNYKQNEDYIKGLKIFITHIKPSIYKNVDNKLLIKNQLLSKNTSGYKFIFLEQGDNIKF